MGLFKIDVTTFSIWKPNLMGFCVLVMVWLFVTLVDHVYLLDVLPRLLFSFLLVRDVLDSLLHSLVINKNYS